MSGFDLVPVDGGDPVHLPPGETVLGRGPLLGISDKRVSRHHGLLENLSGELRLKATHLNPCFIQSTPTNDPRPLQKGSWHVLRHGDFFSLLPGRFIYEVVSVGGDERTPRNSQMLEEEEETLAVPPDPAVDPRPAVRLNQEEPPPSAAPEEDEEAERPFKVG
uniref:Zgc:165656 n=1 Tax=Oreochromis niloticus TaxID=8128 RepID=A0A669DVE6_ORENI